MKVVNEDGKVALENGGVERGGAGEGDDERRRK